MMKGSSLFYLLIIIFSPSFSYDQTTSPAAQAATVDGHVQKKKNEIIDVCKHYGIILSKNSHYPVILTLNNLTKKMLLQTGYSPTSHKPTICRNLFSDLANPLTNGTRDGRREGEEGLKVIQNYFNSLFNPLLGLFGERDRGAGAGKVRFADRRMHEKYYEVGKKCGIPEEIFMVADRFKRFQVQQKFFFYVLSQIVKFLFL